MNTLFLATLVVGAIVLGVQVILSFVGLDADADVEFDAPELDLEADAGDVGGSGAGDGLNLLSVRSIAAALATFGAFGLTLVRWLPDVLAAAIAIVPAFGAAVVTAWLMRQILRLQSSGNIRLSSAVGTEGKVYLPIPASGVRHGLVHVVVQGRMVELPAFTQGDVEIPSAAAVVVAAVRDDGESVEVVPRKTFEEMLHEDDR
ncbi:MAG: hypothetical protein ABFS34_15045 [Gemmatimonadota bacterium]